MEDRIIFSNNQPNDQNSIVPNESLDFSRFSINPMAFYRHGHDPEYGETPIGHWEDWRIEGDNYTGKLVFSSIPEVQKLKTLNKEGNLIAASIGGACIWKTDNFGKEIVTNEGYKIAEKFIVYEISLVPLPSNAGAVKQNVKFYSQTELQHFESIINQPIKQKMDNKQVNEPTDSEVRTEIKQGLIGWAKGLFSTKVPEHVEPDGDEPVKKTKLPTEPQKVGTVKEAEACRNEAEEEAEKHMKKAEAAKKKMENEEDEAEFKKHEAEFKKHKAEAEKFEDLAKKYEAAKKKLESDEEEAKSKNEASKKKLESEAEEDEAKKAEKFAKKLEEAENEDAFKAAKHEAEEEYETQELPEVIKKVIDKKKSKFESIINKIEPQMKTKEELAAEGHKEVPQNAHKIIVASGATFTELLSKESGREVIKNVLNAGGKVKTQEGFASHYQVLDAILNDPRLNQKNPMTGKSVLDQVNFSVANDGRPMSQVKLLEIAHRLSNFSSEVINFKTGKSANYMEFNASDDLLASPDTIAVEWLSLFLYRLYASGLWKSEIPIFAAQEAANNLGVIWTNIAADPAVYAGTKPVNPTAYEVDDTAVSMKLAPFYLQPILWEPLRMALLRYDQMATQWDQSLMKFNEKIDDYLIYTLASLVPTASRVFTSGSSLAIVPNSLDNFVLNPNFYGTVNKPALVDQLIIDQLFTKQNFPEGTKFVTVLDPTAKRYILADTDTKSLLTRFVNSEGSELVSYENAMFRHRSKVALYDTKTGNIVDPSGVIPATSVSAMLSFVPSQVGLGIGNLNVYMIQSPKDYGYIMSADVRMGAALLRADGKGAAIYSYLETHSGA